MRKYIFLILWLTLINQSIYGMNTIKVNQNEIITKPVTYKNTHLDLTHGNFIIEKGGSLDIEHSTINFTLSAATKFFAQVKLGTLRLHDNKFNITANVSAVDPTSAPLYYIVDVLQGSVNITDNVIIIDKPLRAGFLISEANPDPENTNDHFFLSNNNFRYFHGGLVLNNTTHTTITKNTFRNVTYNNIALLDSADAEILDNKFLYSGNLLNGGAIKATKTFLVTIKNNSIAYSMSNAIQIDNSVDVAILQNRIFEGYSYAIYILNQSHLINIDGNLLSMNRYGLAAKNAALNAKNNIFIQRFFSNAERIFWTNNNNLMTNSNIEAWNDNWYKEAFDQEGSDNSFSDELVVYPITGGVHF